MEVLAHLQTVKYIALRFSLDRMEPNRVCVCFESGTPTRQEELEWLGKRLDSERNELTAERLHLLSIKGAEADGTAFAWDDDGEPSVVLPQAPNLLKKSKRRPGVP